MKEWADCCFERLYLPPRPRLLSPKAVKERVAETQCWNGVAIAMAENSEKNRQWVDKYRPKTIQGVIQQEEVVKTLERSLETANVRYI